MFPQRFEYLIYWFLRYKSYEGKLKGSNYYSKNYMDITVSDTIDIITKTHTHWIEDIKNNGFKYQKKSSV